MKANIVENKSNAYGWPIITAFSAFPLPVCPIARMSVHALKKLPHFIIHGFPNHKLNTNCAGTEQTAGGGNIGLGPGATWQVLRFWGMCVRACRTM